MNISNKIKPTLAILIISMTGASSANAGEWEDTMDEIDSCYLSYSEEYKNLPDIKIATSEEVIMAYDKTPHPENCAFALLYAHSIFEEAGYLQIIEYRDDLHERRKSWDEVTATLNNWKEQASIQHSGLSKELQKRKQIELQKTPTRSRSQIIIANNNIVRECRREIYNNNPNTRNLTQLAQACAEANPLYTIDKRQYKCVGLCD